MARIVGRTERSVASIRTFLGLNENPDGETALKNGELGRMWNFRITKDGHLQKRPGCRRVLNVYAAPETQGGSGGAGDDQQAELSSIMIGGDERPEIPTAPEEDDFVMWGPINKDDLDDSKDFPIDPATGQKMHLFGVWHGMVGGKAHVVANYDGHILDLDMANGKIGDQSKLVGEAALDTTRFFGFGDKVYCLDGEHYQVWDGKKDGFQEVEGYAPLIQTATTPGGSGTLLEAVNRLNGLRRVQFSPDGKTGTFVLPDKDIDEVSGVKLNGDQKPSGSYTVNTADGTVTLQTAPPEGTNSDSVVMQGQSEGTPQDERQVHGFSLCVVFGLLFQDERRRSLIGAAHSSARHLGQLYLDTPFQQYALTHISSKPFLHPDSSFFLNAPIKYDREIII